MASKTNAISKREGPQVLGVAASFGDAPEHDVLPHDSPLLDLTDAAVTKLVRSAKQRGYVTHDQINSVLHSGEANSEQIEDILAMFSEMGVNVVETEEEDPRRKVNRTNQRRRRKPRTCW
jgi:RNA polymerase primary sigma factor